MTAALRIDNISKRFGKLSALDSVGFEVPNGAFVVLLGAAGAGKTTTLRLIAGLDDPDTGRITIAGNDLTGTQPRERNVAMIFDNLALYPDKTGFKNIAHPLEIQRRPADEIKEKVDALAGTLRIGHVLSRLPRTMSGGERQRVALGRALIRDPALFLLDEPLSSLDAMLRIELRAELKRMQREHGYSFLMATPDYAEAMAVADLVVMLVNGRIRQIAPPQTLYDDPVDRDVARFVGAPEINLFQASFDPAGAGSIKLPGTVAPAPDKFRQLFGSQAGAFEVGLRPELIVLKDQGHAAGTVVDVETLGLQAVTTFEVDGTILRALEPSVRARRRAAGETVRFNYPLDHALGFEISSGRRIA